MTGSSFDFKALRRNSLPSENQSIDVWILRGQEVLLTKGSKHDDEVVNMMFSGFSTSMHTNFAQVVTPTQQNYNQGLVLEAGLFKFVPMNTSSVYEVCEIGRTIKYRLQQEDVELMLFVIGKH